MDQRFGWDERLHRKSDFKRVFAEGRRYSSAGLTMWALKQPDGRPRLGLAVSKVYGNAVSRNRMKRLLRESFRLNKTKLSTGVDMIFSARPNTGVPAGLRQKPRYQTIEPLVLKLWTLAHLLP